MAAKDPRQFDVLADVCRQMCVSLLSTQREGKACAPAKSLAEKLADSIVGDVFQLRIDARERHGEGPPVADRPNHHSGTLHVCVRERESE